MFIGPGKWQLSKQAIQTYKIWKVKIQLILLAYGDSSMQPYCAQCIYV